MHIDGQLEMAWPDGATLTSTVLATGIAPLGGTARIAPDGRIHLAVYDGALAWSDSSVRYLVIGR